MAARVGNSISRTVDTNMTHTSPEQAMNLDKAFDDAFGPLSEIGGAPPPVKDPPKEEPVPPKEEPPPPKPKEPEPPKPKEEPPAPKPKEEPVPPKEEPPPPKPDDKAKPPAHPDDEEDEELDKIQLHPDSREETITAFRQARGAAKTARKDKKALLTTVETLQKENEQLKAAVRPVSDPTVQAELESLRKFQQTHAIFDDTTYQTQYEAPVRSIFDDIIKDVKSLANDAAAADEWEKSIRAYGPDKLDRQYWLENVINQCADPLHKDRLIRKVNGLLESQGKRDEFRNKMATEPDAYEQFQHQTAANYWKQFSEEAADEAKKIIPTLGEWAMEKDLAMAKTDHERTAWEAHNKTYKEYEELFQRWITAAAKGGPRGMTQVAAQATRGEYFRRELDNANTRLKKVEAELKAAQEELTKISSARSRATSGGNGTAPGTNKPPASKAKIGESVDSAFKREFGT